MSRKYQHPDEVPTEVLADRLDELADAIKHGKDAIDREMTMRIPAELDRDPDLVFSVAAKRLREQSPSDPDGYSSTRSDKDRLDWLIQNSASVHHSRDGECCWISQYDYDGQIRNRIPKSDAREAIDAAMDE